MQKINRTFFFVINITALIAIFFPNHILAQHRGDNLLFQGLSNKNDASVKAAAMGNAFTSIPGELSSLYFNPAGLARMKNIQASVSFNNFSKQWRENQNYRPDRYFVTLPFYLEGLYVPDPANNGKWDYLLAQDTNYNYIVKEPLLGVDPYSKEAADWTHQNNNLGFNNIAAAFPLLIENKNLVFALGYNRDNNFYDFDRNDTYLDPHIGYTGYPGDITRVDGVHTINVMWHRFLRQRTGSLNNITGGLAYEVIDNLMLGFGVNVMWGESDDYQSLVKVGNFLLSNQQRFAFSYVEGSTILAGKSNYKSTSFNVGAIAELNKLRIGIKVDLPYKLIREWDYLQNVFDNTESVTPLSGKDEVDIPAIFNFGLSFTPVEEFTIAFDYEHAPFNKAVYNLTSLEDESLNKWEKRNSIRFGIEYRAFDYLSLIAGYRSIPQVFIPDGSAITDKGPDANSYNIGVSINTFLGKLDIAYELRLLKYYDSYYSNTNYAFEKLTNIMFGYSYSL